MKLLFYSCLLLVGACTSTTNKTKLQSSGSFPPHGTVVEDVEDLGFGFREVTLAEPVSVGWESIGHFAYLYHKQDRICRLGRCQVSPSGRWVIYQEGSSGNLFAFSLSDMTITQLTPSFPGLVSSFEWHEERGEVEVKLYSRWRRSKTFQVYSPANSSTR